MRVQVPRPASFLRFLLHPAGKILLAVSTLAFITALSVFTYFWVHYSRLIDQKLKEGPFAETAQLLATPEPVSVGDALTSEEIVNSLEGEQGQLEEAIKLFERGQALAARCGVLLEAAELKVKQVVGDVILPFDEESE